MVSTQKSRQQYAKLETRRDTSQATVAFVLSLVSWVPLFNLFTNPIAFVFAILSLYNQHKQPTVYGGQKRAIAALVICFVWVCLFLYALVFIGPAVMFKR